MEVDARFRSPERPVLEPVRLPDAQDVAGRLERRHIRLLVRGVGNRERDVDDRFGCEPRNRRRADVLYLQGAGAERVADAVGLVLEELKKIDPRLGKAIR